jgi:CRP/FNR family cyclic AMP-dependent transcriptional regulator
MSDPGRPVDVERLRRLPLFGDLDHHDLSTIARWVREVTGEPGDVLIQQGTIPFEMFVIEEGSVEVERDGQILATLGPGDLVGEMALLQQERRMASVRATSPLRAVAIPAEDLEVLEAEMPEVLATIRETMAARRAELEARDEPPVR